MIAEEIASVSQSHAPSILTDSTDSVDGEILGGGTIIRDTKRKRFRLFPAMLSAITSWFSNTKEAYEESKAPLHTIEKAEHRVAVLEKAVAHSEQAPKDDSKKLAELLKTVERTPITATLTLKNKESVPEPTWASASDDTQNIVEQSRNAIHEPLRKPEPVYTPAVVEPIVEIVPEAVPFVPEVVEEVYVAPVAPVLYKEIVPVPAPLQNQQTQRYAPPRVAQSSFPFYALISVILLASFSGIAFSYYLFAGKQSTVTTLKAPVYEVPKLIQAQNKNSFVLPQDHDALLGAVLAKLEKTNAVIQLYPTVSDTSDANKPAPAETIVGILALQAPGSFTRSIKQITFGSSGKGEPFIVIKATSFDIGFAGMLNWEKMMSADLAPLFGTPVTETFDPQARTASGSHEAFFKDVIASNKNARVLLDENGKDRIVYTFTDQNTILLTTTRDTLAELIGLVQ